jgi:hypothetical protein
MINLTAMDVSTRTATLTANDTLTLDSLRVQKLTPSGGTRTVYLPEPHGQAGLHYVFINASATQNLVIKDADGATVMTVLPLMSGLVFLDQAEGWDILFNSGTYSAVTLTNPTINGCTSASGNFDLSGSSGTFLSCTGANTLSGPVTIAAAATPSLITAAGKTNTGFLQINGKTSGALKLTAADGTAFTVTVTTAAQAGTATLTVPDMGGVSDTFAFNTLAATLANKTLSAPVISAGLTASGSGSNDFSGSSGTFKTSSGANQLSGAVTVTAAVTPSITTAAGKTNTGYVQINGKTSGALKFLPIDDGTETITITTAAQTGGAPTLTIPDFAAAASDTFDFIGLAQTISAIKTFSGGIIMSGAVDLDFQGTTGQPEIKLTTNLADALSVKDSAGDLIVFDLTTGSQVITFTPAVTFNGDVTIGGGKDLTFTGTTGQCQVNLTTNLADALSIKDSAADIIVIATTTGSPTVTITPPTGITGLLTATGGVTIPGAVDLTFTGTTGQSEVVLTTNLADALSIRDSAADIIVITTTTGSPAVAITPATSITGLLSANGGITLTGAVDLTFTGTTGQPEMVLTTNLADALSVKDGAGDLIVFCTTTGAQTVTFTPAVLGTKIQVTATAVTATVDGLTTGLIPSNASHITVTCDNADKIITLPAPVVGMMIRIVTPATGCELRTVASSGVKINDVNSDGTANECALVADSHFICECISATEWIVRGFSKLGADIAALVPDAV